MSNLWFFEREERNATLPSLFQEAANVTRQKKQAIYGAVYILPSFVLMTFFTFIPIFGAYTVPLLVGGKDSYMIGNIIVDQVNKTRNWPLASAFAMIITVVSTAGVLWMMSSSKKEATLKTKADGDRQ